MQINFLMFVYATEFQFFLWQDLQPDFRLQSFFATAFATGNLVANVFLHVCLCNQICNRNSGDKFFCDWICNQISGCKIAVAKSVTNSSQMLNGRKFVAMRFQICDRRCGRKSCRLQIRRKFATTNFGRKHAVADERFFTSVF